MSLDKSLHVRLKTLLATLLNGSVHTSQMWSDLSSDIRCVHNVSENVPMLLKEPFTFRHISTHMYTHLRR